MAKFILRHKLSVVLVWLALSAVSIATIGRLGPRLDYRYTTPGEPGYEANLKIAERFGLDAEFEATLPVLRLPAEITMDSAEARTVAAKTFAAAYACSSSTRGALRGRSSAFLILTTDPARVSRVECRVSYKKQRLPDIC